MRISVRPKDRGYAAFKAIPKRLFADVFLGGALIDRVITADDRLGYVLAIRADDKGGCRLNAKGTQLLLKQHYGDVRIQLRSRV